MRRATENRLLAAVLCVLWGTQFVVQRLALEEAAPPWVAAGRATVAAVVLLPLAGRLRGIGGRGLLTVLALGIANQAGFVGLQVAGLRTVGAGPAAAIIYLQPVLVLLAAGRVLGERLTVRKVVASLLGFAGVAVVGLHQASAVSVGGVLFLLGASVSWTIGTLVTSAAQEPIVPLVVGQHLVGAPLLLIGAALAEPLPDVTAKLAWCVLYAGAGGSALAWLLWSALMRRGDAGVVSTWLFAVPVLAGLLGVVVLDEPLSAELILGIALVAVAVRLAATAVAGDGATAPAPGTAASRGTPPAGRSRRA
ncbi:MAG TPA: DMT family transporter [Solirubrobacteraceae bacterium]|nr:DMT family transporter [Solirubrobacteraceae bacterium]